MNHIQIEALPYCAPVRRWLMDRYGKEADRIWEKTVQNYVTHLRDLPDYGGGKNGHARAICHQRWFRAKGTLFPGVVLSLIPARCRVTFIC